MAWPRALVLGVLLLLCAHVQAANVIEVYPQVPGTTRSTKFEVKVNGQPVFVEEFKNISYAHFAFSGQANIEVTYIPANVSTVKISPTEHAPVATVSGKVVQFSLTVPRKLVVHYINEWAATFRDKDEPRLFVFADPLEENPPSPHGPNVINVGDHDVNNSGAVDVTGKLQGLINGMTSGQTLYFPPGLYKTTGLLVQNRPANCAIYLAGGARLKAGDNPSSAMLSISNTNNFKLYGRGSLHANGFYNISHAYQYGVSLLKCFLSDHVTIEDVLLLDPSMFTLYPIQCQDWRIYNVKIIDYVNFFPEIPPQGYTAGIDGIDLEDCKDIVIDNCFICSGDDSVSVKSGRVPKRFPSDMGNIHVRNAVHYQTTAGRTLGISTLVGSPVVKHVTFENVQTVECDVPFVLTPLNTEDTPTLTNIYFRNIVIERCNERILIGRYYTDKVTGITYYPSYTVNNLQFEAVDITTTATAQHFSVYGVPSANISAMMNGLYFNDTLVTNGYPLLQTHGNPTFNPSYANALSPFVNVEAINPEMDEYGGSGSLFRFTRTGDATNTLTVKFQLRGSGVNGVDYQTLPTTVTIPSGETSVNLPVTALTDGATEGVETILVSLTNDHASPYMIGPDYQAYMQTDDSTIFRLDFADALSTTIFANATTASGEARLVPGTAATVERGLNQPVPSSSAAPVRYNAVNIPRSSNTDNSGLEVVNTSTTGSNNNWNSFFGNTFGNGAVIMVYKPNYSGIVTAAGPAGRKYFFSHESGSTSKSVSLFISDNVDGPELRMGGTTAMSVNLPNFSWDSNSWYFIAASWSPGQRGRIYVRSLAAGAVAQFAESSGTLVDAVPTGPLRFGVCSTQGGVLSGQNADGKFAYVALLKEYATQASFDTYYANLKNGPDLSAPTASVALKYDFRFAGDIVSDYSVATYVARGIEGATVSNGALNIPRTSTADSAGLDLGESAPGLGDHRWNDFFGNTFGEGTIGFLYKPNVSGTRKGGAANRMHFFTHRQGALTNAFAIFNNDSSGGPTLRLGRSGSNFAEAALSDFPWDSSSWYYIGASWKVGGEARIYVRKQGGSTSSARYAASTSQVTDLAPSSMDGLLRIGTRSNGDDSLGGENADGKMRYFRMMGRQMDQANFDDLSTTALATVP